MAAYVAADSTDRARQVPQARAFLVAGRWPGQACAMWWCAVMAALGAGQQSGR
jgi:hypothetical protein